MLFARFLLAFGSTVAAAGAGSGRTVNVAGTYASNYGEVRLTQDGDRIHGTYPCCGGGTLEGRLIEGAILRFRWHEPNGAGEGNGVWRIDREHHLRGSWGRGLSDHDGGSWDLIPQRQIAEGPSVAR